MTFETRACIVNRAWGDPHVPVGSHGRILAWESGEAAVLWNPGTPGEMLDVMIPQELSRECVACLEHKPTSEISVRDRPRLRQWLHTMGIDPPLWLGWDP